MTLFRAVLCACARGIVLHKVSQWQVRSFLSLWLMVLAYWLLRLEDTGMSFSVAGVLVFFANILDSSVSVEKFMGATRLFLLAFFGQDCHKSLRYYHEWKREFDMD
jgi:hypothetical protein